MSDIPVGDTGSSLAQNIWGTIAGDDRLSSAAAIPGEILGLGTEALFAMKDPIFALSSAVRDGLNYSLWKGVLLKAAIGAGTSLAGNVPQAAADQLDAMTASIPSAGSTGGSIAVDLDELDGLRSALEGLKGQADPIQSQSAETMAEEMAWGVPGAIGLEGHYMSTTEGLGDAISEIVAAFDGHAIRIGACRDDYAACDQEQAEALNKLLSEF